MHAFQSLVYSALCTLLSHNKGDLNECDGRFINAKSLFSSITELQLPSNRTSPLILRPSLHTFSTTYPNIIPQINLPPHKGISTVPTPKTVSMKLLPQRLHNLPNNILPTQPTLRSPPQRALFNTPSAPSIPIQLHMRHSLIERITAFAAEEVPVVVMFASQGGDVLTDDGGFAVLTPRRKSLVPVEVAIEPKFLITIRHLSLLYIVSSLSRLNPSNARFSGECWLGRNLEIGQGLRANMALHACWMPTFFQAGQSNDTAFDWERAGVACCCGSCAYRSRCW